MRGLSSKNGNKLLAAVRVTHYLTKTGSRPHRRCTIHLVIYAEQMIVLVADYLRFALFIGTSNGIFAHYARFDTALPIL